MIARVCLNYLDPRSAESSVRKRKLVRVNNKLDATNLDIDCSTCSGHVLSSLTRPMKAHPYLMTCILLQECAPILSQPISHFPVNVR
jgi:hypothetical protein